MKFWFFGDGGKTLVACVECSIEFARRHADLYNRDSTSAPKIDLIADNKDPDQASIRIAVSTDA